MAIGLRENIKRHPRGFFYDENGYEGIPKQKLQISGQKGRAAKQLYLFG